MTLISHEDARRLMQARADGLLSETERIALEAHLKNCESCQAQAAELQALNEQLSNVLKTRLESNREPSVNLLARVQENNRRNIVMNRIQFSIRTLAGIAALLLVAFAFAYAIPRLHGPAAETGTDIADYSQRTPAAAQEQCEDISYTVQNGDTFNSIAAHFKTSPESIQRMNNLQPDGLYVGMQILVPCQPNTEFKPRPVVFAAKGENGDMEIFVLRSPGQEPENISNNPGYDGRPVWSPDGRLIAFESERNGNRDIFIINPEGSGLKQVTASAFNEAINPLAEYYGLGSSTGLFNPLNVWSPDGKSLLIHSDPDGAWQVEVIDVESGAATLLLEQAISMAVWSPDSKQIAFIASGEIDNQPPIEVVNRDGTNRRVLSSGKSANGDLTWEQAGILSWSSDGQSIFVDYNDLSGNWGIAKIAVGGQEAPEPIRKGYVLDGGFPAAAWISPEDNLYYITTRQSSMIYSWQKVLDNTHLITDWNIRAMCGLAGSSKEWSVQERWGIAPDSQKAILVLSCPNTETSELYQLDLNSGEARKIAAYDALWENISFSWSSDSEFALVQAQNAANEEIELIQIQDDTLGTVLLRSSQWHETVAPSLQPFDYWTETSEANLRPNANEPVASQPNNWLDEYHGNLIAFLSTREGNSDIFVAKEDGSQLTNLTNSPEYEYDLTWSADGQWLAFTRDYSSAYIMQPDSGQITPIATGNWTGVLRWTPDSQKIAALASSGTSDATKLSLQIIGIDGVTLQTIELVNQPNLDIQRLDWSDDGKRIYYIQKERSPDSDEILHTTLYQVQLENPTPRPLIESESTLDAWTEVDGKLSYLQRTAAGWNLMQTNDGTTVSLKATWLLEPPKCESDPESWQNDAEWASFSWSPDGQKLLIAVPCKDGNVWLYLGDINGNITQVLNYPLDTSANAASVTASWSSDGKTIIFSAQLEARGNPNLYRLDLAAALENPSIRPEAFLQSGFDESAPAWQP